MKLYQKLAQTFQAWLNCHDSGNNDWLARHEETIEELVKEHMPSGSGFDSGTRFVFISSQPEKLVFSSAYHHMNENGYYDGWSEFDIIVTPSLTSGFDVRLRSKGPFPRKYADTKDYILETFQEILDKELAS